MKTVLSILVVILLVACSEQPSRPFAIYRADYDPGVIPKTEAIIDEIASQFEFRVFRKNREQMAYLTRGTPAFYTALYFGEHAVLTISNVGAGKTVTIHATDFGHVDRSKLNQALELLVHKLKSELGLRLEAQNAA